MKLRIKNFRSIADTNDIDIRPITMLIGKNSSGKSSFLRTFPMLRQSTEERTKSPILLYGNWVDFGSYKDIRPHFSREDERYELGFTFDDHFFDFMDQRFRYGRYRQVFHSSRNFIISYNLKFEEGENELIQINEIENKFFNHTISIKLDRKKQLVTSIIVNGITYFKTEDNIRFLDSGGFTLDFLKDKKSAEFSQLKEKLSDIIQKKIINSFSSYFLPSTSQATKLRVFHSLNFAESDVNLLTKIKSIKSPKKWHQKVAKWTTENQDFKALKDLTALFDFANLFSSAIDHYLNNTFSGIKYLAPLRATAERYYRIQHLAVDEVDPNGKNLPIFLDSLTETQLSAFQHWTFEHFSFRTKISKLGGHYSIKIVQDEYETNLSDMGFGYSQILPIITQLWYTASRFDTKRMSIFNNYKNKKYIIVIEQPELHLHPDFQAKFADAISKVIKLTKENETHLSLIIETHSDIIINRLGDCVLSGEISEDDINIVIFDKSSEREPTQISTSSFNNDGCLINWPLGFFLPSVKQ